MKYSKIILGKFIDRPNRFIAHVEINEKIETVHVKNTGRCKELLVPGCAVILEDFSNRSDRKTKFDLIATYKKTDKKTLLINMDSQAPNKVVAEWLLKQNYDYIKPEFTYGNSRVDFYMESGNKKFLLEVKGCTLEQDGIGFFPDAPTQRGVKHLYELAEASKNGFICYLAFVIQIPGVEIVYPNVETHPQFGEALEYAKRNGVKILYLKCDVKDDELKIIDNSLETQTETKMNDVRTTGTDLV